MEIITLPQDLKVFGVIVKSFPNGIGEAFDEIIARLPQGDTRPYYGISQCINGNVVYKAAALETFAGEGAKYGYETFAVEGGDYLSKTIWDWRPKTSTVKDVISELLQDERTHKEKPCVEIYKDDNELLCLVKMNHDLSEELQYTTGNFLQTLSSFNTETINKVPFEESWTAAQVGDHVLQSMVGMTQLLTGPTAPTQRNVAAFVERIEEDFLNFTIKFKSPGSILPKEKVYDKEALLNSLSDVVSKLNELSKTLDLNQTCTAFPFPVYGELTRLELFHFIVCHTKRHLHQLQNIKEIVEKK